MARFIALLRGINVGGHAMVPMAELREICAGLGWTEVETYIQSGNLVFEASGKGPALESALEEKLETAFGFRPAVIVRSAAQVKALADANPFPEASENRAQPGYGRPQQGQAEGRRRRGDPGEGGGGRDGERCRRRALVPLSERASGTSKLTPTLIDRTGRLAADRAQLADTIATSLDDPRLAIARRIRRGDERDAFRVASGIWHEAGGRSSC